MTEGTTNVSKVAYYRPKERPASRVRFRGNPNDKRIWKKFAIQLNRSRLYLPVDGSTKG
jgi:hypothetical protein